MKTIGMAAAAFLVACGASAAHGAFERDGNTKDSSADEIAKYESVAGLPYGEIAGVLWHQGETDALKMDEARYKELFAQMAARVRKEAGRDVPIVVGEIGRFMETESARMNPIIASCAAETPMCACISSEGLLNQDKFHFDRASAEELGRRFYAAWKELAK